MKLRVCFLIVVLVCLSVAGQSYDQGLRAYLAQNGIDPGLLNRRGSPVRLVERDGEAKLLWDAARLGRRSAPSLDALPGPEEAQAILDAWEAGEDEKLQNAKSQDQKTLENEYFALVEEIYVAAGEGAPSLEEAKNFGQARAKIAKARQNKPGTGQGNKKTADDALEFLDMQLKLQGLDLELREHDSNWRGNAKKHELE